MSSLSLYKIYLWPPMLFTFILCGCLEINVPLNDMYVLIESSNPSNPSNSSSASGSPIPFDLSSMPNSTDAFVPTSLADWSQANSAQSFGLCISNMKLTLLEMKQQNCGMYTLQEQQNPSSDYHRNFVVSACLYLACDQRVIEGHNGVMISKSCAELDDLYAVLERAEEQALNGECSTPTYQTAWLPLDQFQGGESCDQIQCSVGPDVQLGF